MKYRIGNFERPMLNKVKKGIRTLIEGRRITTMLGKEPQSGLTYRIRTREAIFEGTCEIDNKGIQLCTGREYDFSGSKISEFPSRFISDKDVRDIYCV
jgi:hypothetical protein